VLQTKGLDLFMLIQWENLQVVDISFPVHRVGMMVDTTSNPLVDSNSINRDLLGIKWAMEENGWKLITVNYEEYKQGGVDYVENLRK
jgi:hypothetical protein